MLRIGTLLVRFFESWSVVLSILQSNATTNNDAVCTLHIFWALYCLLTKSRWYFRCVFFCYYSSYGSLLFLFFYMRILLDQIKPIGILYIRLFYTIFVQFDYGIKRSFFCIVIWVIWFFSQRQTIYFYKKSHSNTKAITYWHFLSFIIEEQTAHVHQKE